MVEPEPVRSLVLGFLSVSEALARARLVCRSWSRTLAAWDTVTNVRALQAALRPRALELPHTSSLSQLELDMEVGRLEDLSPTLPPSLVRVNLAGWPIRNHTLLRLGPRIRSLDLRKTLACTDGLLTCLCSLPELEELWLPGNPRVPDFLRRAAAVPGLTSRLRLLYLSAHVAEDELHFVTAFWALESLEIPYCKLQNLDWLRHFTRLRSLALTNLTMTWSVADFPLLPGLRSLDLSRFQSLDLEEFYDICRLSLTSLILHGASVSVGVDWSDLRRLKKLERLDLSFMQLPSSAFEAMRDLPLRELVLQGNRGGPVYYLEGHPTLERLDLEAAFGLLAQWLDTLPRLRWLSLKRTAVASRNLATLFQRGVVVLT
jgi:hypothetical protein